MQKSTDYITIVVLGSVFVLLITLFVVFLLMAYRKREFRHLKEKKRLQEDFNNQLLQSQIEVQEQTFQHIGKELHDNVGQLLSSSRMLMGLAERSLDSPPDTLITANKTLGQAIQEVRSLSKSLDKDWLEQFNFAENLKAEVDRINAGNNIRADLIIKSDILFSTARQIILFRIVQEAIQNAIKHADATHLNIFIAAENKVLSITIADDGKGFDVEQSSKGMGLNNMKHRTGLIKGTIKYYSHPGKGSTVSILVPENND